MSACTCVPVRRNLFPLKLLRTWFHLSSLQVPTSSSLPGWKLPESRIWAIFYGPSAQFLAHLMDEGTSSFSFLSLAVIRVWWGSNNSGKCPKESPSISFSGASLLAHLKGQGRHRANLDHSTYGPPLRETSRQTVGEARGTVSRWQT